MNFSAIPDHTLVGRLLRFPLRFIPPDFSIPIVQGRLRGMRWVVGAGSHGCWLGSYEYDQQRVFEQIVTPGGVVFDVGAHAGFYALLASVLVGPGGQVIAFEPSTRNLTYLREHLRINRIQNVTIIDAAVADSSGYAHFRERTEYHSYRGRLANDGGSRVRTVRLDDLIREGSIPTPNFMKIDVEGGEPEVLRGARWVIESVRPTIFLETHGANENDACCKLLEASGYELRPMSRRSPRYVLAQAGQTHGIRRDHFSGDARP